MKRKTASFLIKDASLCKQQMLNWVNRFSICCFLDNHGYASNYQTIECMAAAGATKIFNDQHNLFIQLSDFNTSNHDWLFGHLSYDLKNKIAPLHSSHPDHIGFPDLFFFQPEIVVQLKNEQCIISSLTKDPEIIFNEIIHYSTNLDEKKKAVSFKPRISKEGYFQTIDQLLKHIQRGDCYEINFCQEFYAEDAFINPVNIYAGLTTISPNPFSAFYKLTDKYLLCASPERYIRRKGNQLISQPIKGTYKRDLTDKVKDDLLKKQLRQSPKDRSENVMIVDLVRNDLSRICKEGTVKVDELFGIYSFPQVHQMISTISGELNEGKGFADIIRASFPMGSMTGAPKLKVMQLIEQYEKTKRGIYSGAVGYINPDNDFDFNVVIRSILYNETNHYLSYLVGGGITFQSDPEKEYEECLLKAAAIEAVFQTN